MALSDYFRVYELRQFDKDHMFIIFLFTYLKTFSFSPLRLPAFFGNIMFHSDYLIEQCGKTNRWMNEWMDGHMDTWMMDEWMDIVGLYVYRVKQLSGKMNALEKHEPNDNSLTHITNDLPHSDNVCL